MNLLFQLHNKIIYTLCNLIFPPIKLHKLCDSLKRLSLQDKQQRTSRADINSEDDNKIFPKAFFS